MIGQTISHYKILEKLGAGGMGVVYKARDTKLDRFVALKFLPPHLRHGEEGTKRFINEARVASALDHPGICTIYEIDETEDGQMFIAMACYEGKSLKQALEGGPLPVASAVDIAMQVAAGLAKAHSRQIFHRDIKPANIMVAEDGQAKIIDFGLARFADQSRITKSGAAPGTVAYMSPEQVQGADLDQRSDVWSLGVVLYEMVTGKVPFAGDYEPALMYAIMNEGPRSVVELRPDIPAGLAQLITKALQKDREDRYHDMDAVLSELQRIRDRSRVTAGPEEKLRPSIAVLPFVNMSADLENEYFSDGLAEELINVLGKIKELRVVARTSAFSFKGRETDIRDIGRKLNVDTVLEGSVRKAGDRLRISSQLVNVADGYRLWSESYDREAADIFAIQDEISLSIVDKLKIELLGEDEARLVTHSTDNSEAYGSYLKGRYYWNRRTVEGFRTAVQYFEKAIALTPTYAPAYAGLADSYAFLGDAGHAAIPPKEAFSKANAAVRKALEIDETLAEAHASLAHLRMHDFDWDGAGRELRRAIGLNPDYATAHQWLGFYFALRGQTHEAVAAMERALETDPVSLAIITDMGVIFYYARQFDEAIAWYHKTLEMEPGFVRVYMALGSAYGQKGMYPDAIAMFQKAIDVSGDRSKIAALGQVYGLSGRKDEARKIIGDLQELSKQRYISPYSIALIHANLGERDQAFDWLQKAYDERVSELIYLKADPYLDALRSDARFTGVLKKVGLDK